MADSITNFSRLRQQVGISLEELAPIVGFSLSTLYRWERGQQEPRQAAMVVLQGLLNARAQAVNEDPLFTFIDLFAGIGGLRRGFDHIGGKCVFTSEWDKYSQATYKANYRCDDHDVNGDITKVDAADIPPHDVLLAGFPCQPFSIAGVSKKNALGRAHGFADETQGTLFFDVVRIIKHHRPKAFLLENVKNLVNHDRGRTFKVIMKKLQEELDYEVEARVINAKGYVPQNRERIFIIGFRRDLGVDFSFSDFEMRDPYTGPKLEAVLHPEDGSEAPDKHYTVGNIGSVSDRYTLSDHLWKYLRDYAAKHAAAGNGFGYGLVGPNDVARTLSARYYKDGSEILIDRGPGKNPRRLTPRECARLMGFEEQGKAEFVIPVSDTQAYRQFGNSVVVPVVKAIAVHMLPAIEQALAAAADEQIKLSA
ncbi:DNA (cytosine-5-)-methyltransferase [Nitratireductor rhodophyticola]|uniref:DNA (cytosine-5-)-methyltransferase n=1 Tax=Nitratireductor rhodophyticola TaxID=2854036 RepID=UPI002AC97DAD|nr:DNA (cytosine-5-)-methyltransferase [Nitratireductor rhodophyticola]WPZ13098.1 DNA (cytosine-5-)-methyltransferase [Nitratireductor rhodophyticola]